MGGSQRSRMVWESGGKMPPSCAAVGTLRIPLMEAEGTIPLPPAASLGALPPALPPGSGSSQFSFKSSHVGITTGSGEKERAIPSAPSGSAWSELRVWISGRQQLLGLGLKTGEAHSSTSRGGRASRARAAPLAAASAVTRATRPALSSLTLL